MFDYDAAFSRNLGWVTEAEQQQLRQKCIAIAGLGGVGGSHLLTLTRLGIGKFKLADFDTFDIPNFNRQAGAMMSTVGQPKAEVLARMAKDINPELKITSYPGGVDKSNLDAFLDGVDLYVDSLDFFAFEARRNMFAACAAKGIPAITAAPLGMGTAMLIFMPGGMTFEEYFRLDGHDEFEQGIRFLLGLAPARLHNAYLVDPSRIDLENRKGPSTGMACQLCAGVAATNALKILLKRGDIIAAPKGLHFDAYSNKLTQTCLRNGNQGVLQKLKIRIAKSMLSKQQQVMPDPNSVPASATPIEKVLDMARWAPSGDNTQIWRFELIDATSAWVLGHDTRDEVVYDINGRPSQIALGALLETLLIAASTMQYQADIEQESPAQDTPNSKSMRFKVSLRQNVSLEPSPLATSITSRSVQRRALKTTPISTQHKQALASALGAGFSVKWFEGNQSRRKIAALLFKSAKIRLTMPEAYQVHRSIIQWNARFSEDKVPDQAIGMDPVALKMMRWALQSWQRVRMLNRYFAGTWLPRIQLDWVPAMACGAHFVICADKPAQTIADYIQIGRALQRFWLTATHLGIQLQPEMTPLIFASYVHNDQRFSKTPEIWNQAVHLEQEARTLLGADTLKHAGFMGRVGYGNSAQARSLRLPLSRLLIRKE
jgi:molybdopterin/thiamine biosynthesis adenylyltransferase